MCFCKGTKHPFYERNPKENAIGLSYHLLWTRLAGIMSAPVRMSMKAEQGRTTDHINCHIKSGCSPKASPRTIESAIEQRSEASQNTHAATQKRYTPGWSNLFHCIATYCKKTHVIPACNPPAFRKRPFWQQPAKRGSIPVCFQVKHIIDSPLLHWAAAFAVTAVPALLCSAHLVAGCWRKWNHIIFVNMFQLIRPCAVVSPWPRFIQILHDRLCFWQTSFLMSGIGASFRLHSWR